MIQNREDADYLEMLEYYYRNKEPDSHFDLDQLIYYRFMSTSFLFQPNALW